MQYVKIELGPDCRKSACGRLTYVECGLPDASGNAPVFILEEGAENNLPAWAASELEARGHKVVEINSIRDGTHCCVDGATCAEIDLHEQIEVMPDHEVDRFLRHHGYHDHIMPLPSEAKVETNVEAGASAGLGHRLRSAADAPENLRSKAIEMHRTLGAQRIAAANKRSRSPKNQKPDAPKS